VEHPDLTRLAQHPQVLPYTSKGARIRSAQHRIGADGRATIFVVLGYDFDE
jgi:hypothetical protein